jgi:hypothetical protein
MATGLEETILGLRTSAPLAGRDLPVASTATLDLQGRRYSVEALRWQFLIDPHKSHPR